MTELVRFNAELKENVGKGPSRAFRREDKIPAIIYGEKEANIMVAIPLNKFRSEYEKGNLKTKLVEIDLGKEIITAIPKDIQFHPVSDLPVHIDFRRVNKNTIIRMEIRIKIINEDKSPGVKKGGVINLVHRSINMLCDPARIPHCIEVDISGLEIGKNLHISNIVLPEGVEPVDKANFTVVSIVGRAAEEAVTAVVAATDATATAVAGATPAAAGATPAAATPASATKK